MDPRRAATAGMAVLLLLVGSATALLPTTCNATAYTCVDLNQACNYASNIRCRDGLYCDPITKVCLNAPTLGNNCTTNGIPCLSLQNGTYDVTCYANSTCALLPYSPGETCSSPPTGALNGGCRADLRYASEAR